MTDIAHLVFSPLDDAGVLLTDKEVNAVDCKIGGRKESIPACTFKNDGPQSVSSVVQMLRFDSTLLFEPAMGTTYTTNAPKKPGSLGLSQVYVTVASAYTIDGTKQSKAPTTPMLWLDLEEMSSRYDDNDNEEAYTFAARMGTIRGNCPAKYNDSECFTFRSKTSKKKRSTSTSSSSQLIWSPPADAIITTLTFGEWDFMSASPSEEFAVELLMSPYHQGKYTVRNNDITEAAGDTSLLPNNDIITLIQDIGVLNIQLQPFALIDGIQVPLLEAIVSPTSGKNKFIKLRTKRFTKTVSLSYAVWWSKIDDFETQPVIAIPTIPQAPLDGTQIGLIVVLCIGIVCLLYIMFGRK
jgi:hypothetical protein